MVLYSWVYLSCDLFWQVLVPPVAAAQEVLFVVLYIWVYLSCDWFWQAHTRTNAPVPAARSRKRAQVPSEGLAKQPRPRRAAVQPALDAGYWVGMTLYPVTKCTPDRACDMVVIYGGERMMVNSAGDWGRSDPMAVAEFVFTMRRRGHSESLIKKVVLDNPLAFWQKSRRWPGLTPRP